MCGAVTPRVDNSWSHYTYVLSRSTAANRDVVECFKRNSSDHFNVGLGVDDPETGFEMETAPFEEFIAAAERETEEVFFEIMQSCGLSHGHLLLEEEGELRIIVNPAVRQLPDPRFSEKVACVRQALRRLGRELAAPATGGSPAN
jgi:hypothetical protein